MCKKLVCLSLLIVVLALAGNAAAQLDPASITDGHVYLFENVGADVPDDSANSHTANLVGNPQVVDSPGGKSLLFNGINDGVHIPDSAMIGNTGTHQNRTVIAVFNCADVSKSDKQVVFDEGGYTRGLSIYVHEGLVYGAGWNKGGDYSPEWSPGAFISAPIGSNEWHSVAIVLRDGGVGQEDDKFEMWMDGALIGRGPGGELRGHSNDNAIGYAKENVVFHDGNGSADGHYFEGMIDEIWIINTALTEPELISLAPEPWPYAFGPTPADGALVEAAWANLDWRPGGFAVSHDVYIGESFNDVNDGVEGAFAGNTTSNTQIIGFFGFPVPGGLQPGTTYYWRVDAVNNAEPNSPWKGDVWSFTVPPKEAYNLVPADGTKFVAPDQTLTWTAGLQAMLHHVYLGENTADVEAGAPGTYKGAFTETTYAVSGLELDKVYYWRIDEFDGANTTQGEVLSFQVKPDIPITDPNLVCWWHLDEGQGNIVLDWSGHGNDTTFTGEPQWVDGIGGTALNFDGVDDSVISRLADEEAWQAYTVTVWAKANALWQSVNSCIFANHTTFAVDTPSMQISFDSINNYQYHGSVDEIIGPATTGWVHLAVACDGAATTVYYDGNLISSMVTDPCDPVFNKFAIGINRAEDNWFDGSVDDLHVYNKVLTQDEIQLVMRIDPLVAWQPSPTDGSLAPMNVAATLKWAAGDGGSQHDVYYGSDQAVVAAADASDTTGAYRGRQGTTSYAPPEGIDPNSGPHYWRIDEVANDGAIVPGRLWSHSVTDYALVDDFEYYNDTPLGEPGSNLVYVAWKDGYDNPGANGATMGYVTGESMETGTVHGGNQSVAFQYNNVTAGVSEVVRTFTPEQNWAANGLQTLSIWFAGAGTNMSGQLYVKINGVQVNYNSDAGNLALAGWQVWNIDLALIATDVSSVTSLAIGVQGPGATGILLLDDIRVYPYPSEVVTPVQPGAAGLVLHYAFDGNTNDSTGGNPGLAAGSPLYLPGKIGQAIMLDGLDDYVAIDSLSYAERDLAEVSVSAWIRTNIESNQIIASFDRDNYWRLEISGDGAGPGQVGWDVMTSTGQVDYGSNTRVDDDQWHHVAGVFDNGTLTIYIDGNPETPASGGPTFGSGTTRFGYIGLGSESTAFNADPKTPANYFTGSVDDVRVYDRALTGGEVAGLAGRISPFDKPF